MPGPGARRPAQLRGDGQELTGVVVGRVEPADLVELEVEVAAKALGLAYDHNRVAALEPRPDPVDLAEHPARDRPRAVAQLQGEVGRSVAGRQPVLAHACVAALDPPAWAQLGDRRASVSHCFEAGLAAGALLR